MSVGNDEMCYRSDWFGAEYAVSGNTNAYVR
ncbi:unnamed protein product, partial [Rotaria sp. Silwood1]